MIILIKTEQLRDVLLRDIYHHSYLNHSQYTNKEYRIFIDMMHGGVIGSNITLKIRNFNDKK